MKSDKSYIPFIEQMKLLNKYTINNEFNKARPQNGYYIYQFWKQ